MNSRSMVRGSAALLAVFAAACSEVPSALRLTPADASLGKIPGVPSKDLGKANIEFFEVCKFYRGGTGPDVVIDVAVTGTTIPTNFQVTLADGQCKDVWLHGFTADQVTVTEQVP